MKAKFALFSSLLFIVGCSSLPKEASIQNSYQWLSSHRENLVNGMTIAGVAAMDSLLGDAEKKKISDEMWAAATLFNSLAGQSKVLSTKELDGMLEQFAPSWNDREFKSYRESVALVYGLGRTHVESLIKSKVPEEKVEAGRFINAIFLILAEAAQNIASHYK